ncbi:MAG: class I SAM-dependent methyltransferase [Halodesulfurarchaeum sp.]
MDADDVRREWEGRDGAYSPRYYAYYGADEVSEAIASQLDDHGPADPAILEVGCSAGRHLAHLYDRGYRDLWGIDVNPESFSVLQETYPNLAEDGTFLVGAMEDILPGMPDAAFDLVYSVETLQHIPHENAGVFEEVARISGDLVVTVEVEREMAGQDGEDAINYVDGDFPIYYRKWEQVFEEFGLVQLDSVDMGRQTMRVFHSPNGT